MKTVVKQTTSLNHWETIVSFNPSFTSTSDVHKWFLYLEVFITDTGPLLFIMSCSVINYS